MTQRLFGTDGVRGVAGRWPLTAGFVEKMGRVAGRVLDGSGRGRRLVFMVRDTRASGPALSRALAKGLVKAGYTVRDGGVLPTPAVAALLPRLRARAGVVISASHNPSEFNGIKFFGPDGTKLSDDLERAIEAGLAGDGSLPTARGGRLAPHRAAAGDYLSFLKSTWPRGASLRGLTVALDGANGSTSFVAGTLLRSLGATVLPFFTRPDGRNINRGCGAVHPERLAAALRRHKAHVGVAFDGDGDRAIFVDEAGRVRDGDAVLLVAARHWKLSGRLKKNLAVVTVMANLGLRRALDALGIDTVETSVGDKYVWRAMAETGAVLGGEQSGHTIFADYLPTGDGLLTALQTLGVMAATGRPLSALSALSVRYPQVILNVKVREKKPLESLNGFMDKVKEIQRRYGPTGRVLVRYSGTEPLLRIMIEGTDADVINRDARLLASHVKV